MATLSFVMVHSFKRVIRSQSVFAARSACLFDEIASDEKYLCAFPQKETGCA